MKRSNVSCILVSKNRDFLWIPGSNLLQLSKSLAQVNTKLIVAAMRNTLFFYFSSCSFFPLFSFLFSLSFSLSIRLRFSQAYWKADSKNSHLNPKRKKMLKIIYSNTEKRKKKDDVDISWRKWDIFAKLNPFFAIGCLSALGKFQERSPSFLAYECC